MGWCCRRRGRRAAASSGSAVVRYMMERRCENSSKPACHAAHSAVASAEESVSESWLPNVSPKEVYAEPSEGVFLIAEIASGRSLRNIRANPAVCISLIDVFSQRGRRLEGRAWGALSRGARLGRVWARSQAA